VPHFKTKPAGALANAVALALMAAFAVGQLLLALDRSPSADDALFLSVPKNWLNGYGWATSYSEKIPFNPDFTGPAALLLPAALLIKLFGNQWWIAGITGWAVNLALSALCLWQIRFYGKNPALTMLCLTCGIVAGFAQDFSSLVGYYTGSLSFLLATCIAFNTRYSTMQRAIVLGAMSAISLLIKPLLVPAFIWLSLIFLVATFTKKRLHLCAILACLIAPALLVSGWSALLREDALKDYSPAYRESYRQYEKNFTHHHGSGIGQWKNAKEKIPYVLRNANKNLYFVEEGLSFFGIKNPFLGNAPADVHHIIGALYIVGIMFLASLSGRKIVRSEHHNPIIWMQFTLSTSIFIYILWFVLFAMAMSPGHLYFPMQWTLWLLFLLFAQHINNTSMIKNIVVATLAITLSLFVVMDSGYRRTIFLQDRSDIKRTDGLDQAIRYIKSTQHPTPLAGCGYSSYPRHIEYGLATSQNFSDCLDLIEDHITQKNQHYEWQSTLAFTLVVSLQSMGFEPAASRIISACRNNILYRNSDIYIFQCNFDELKALDLNALMQEIQATHEWYKTRLR